MQMLISDQNFGDDARLEGEVAEAVGVEVTVASCRDEDDVADALERTKRRRACPCAASARRRT